MGQQRRKGYTRNPRISREEMIARTPKRTFLTGTFGTVEGVYALIDKRLEEMDWNWVTLASEIPVSRQHLERVVKQRTIPLDMFLRICAVLQIDPKTVIKPEKIGT